MELVEKGTIKKETEGLLTAAQEQALYELRASRIACAVTHVLAMWRKRKDLTRSDNHPMEVMPDVQPPMQG